MATKKKSTPPKTVKKPTKKPANKPKKEQPQERNTEIGAFACIACALLLLYFFFFAKQVFVSYITAGLFGSVKFVLPISLIWQGVRMLKTEKKGTKLSFMLSLLLMVIITALVHAFCADGIVRSLSITTFVNFVRKSYLLQDGGGAIGAVFCWPVYWILGKDQWGCALIFALLAAGDLILMKKISLRRIGEKVQNGVKGAKKSLHEHMIVSTEDDLMHETEVDPTPRKPIKRHPVETPRHITIQKVENTVPGEPVVKPAPTKAAETVDVPEYLKGKQVKHFEEMEDIRIEEPEIVPRKKKAAVVPKVAPVPEALPVAPREEDLPVEEMPIAPADELDVFDLPKEEEISDIPSIGPIEEPAIPVRTHAPEIAPVKPKFEPAATPVEIPTGERNSEPLHYCYPPIDILAQAKTQREGVSSAQNDQAKGQKLVDTLASFGIAVTLVGIAHGPTVTRFELSPAPGIKVSRITSLADDIALNLAAVSVRIEAPIPGKAAVGVEVPNDVIETVPLRDVLESEAARKNASRTATALGRDNAGRYIVCDLAKMPHLLIAGQTGSGKSVCINCIICSILYRATPDEVRMILIDPKVVELSAYNGIPHLLVPVVTDPKKAAGALQWAVSEMQERYKKFAAKGVRDIKGFNQHLDEDEPKMPQIVIIIDELADLMMVAPGDVEDAICRLAQLARAAGIYLVIATQRPSVNVITGVIKANIPSRIAFTVASQVDSRTILDYAGADKLLGRGDMLYAPSGIGKPWRAQGAWVSDDEVHEIVSYISRFHSASYNEDVIEHLNNISKSDAEKEETASEYDALLPEAISTVVELGQASTSMLQRKMRIGYARAGRLIDEMERRGIISPGEGSKPRDVLMTREQFHQMFDEEK